MYSARRRDDRARSRCSRSSEDELTGSEMRWTAHVRLFVRDGRSGDDRVSSTGRTLRCVEAHHIRPAPNARGLIDRRWHRERSALSIIRLVAAARGACLRLGQCARGPTPYRGGHQPFARRMFIGAFTGADKDPATPLRRARSRSNRVPTRRRGCQPHIPGGMSRESIPHFPLATEYRRRCFKSLSIVTFDNHRVER